MKCLIRNFVTFLFLVSAPLFYPQSSNLSDFNFLIGGWVGSGGGTASGQGTGVSAFFYDIDSNVIIRDNYAQYPAQDDKPAYTHQDKMIIYKQSGQFKALYIDNEKHVINYDISLSGGGLVFTSQELKGTPQFRLTYEKPEGNKMKLIFEIAMPNTPGKFTQYLTAEMTKRKEL